MFVRPECVIKNTSILPGSQRRDNNIPAFESGDRIVWNDRTARLTYEQANGSLRGILALVGTVRDAAKVESIVVLPGPSSYEQARMLVFMLAAARRRELAELRTDRGEFIWVIQ
ncbi:MAG TPA: hypothetical protein VN397_01015 [Candidatus Methylomirabilis sp.]|nr:hypothetical protein [Candidatus Methylomirabilis sp.]